MTVQHVSEFLDSQPMLRSMIALTLMSVFGLALFYFQAHSFTMAEHLSSPQIMIKGRR